MPIEAAALQQDMFTGELVDARTASQKQRDRERHQLQQPFLFSTRSMYQTHASTRPWLKTWPAGPMVLVIEEVRTPEQQEADLLREAHALTVPLFEASEEHRSEGTSEQPRLFPVDLLLRVLLQTSDLLTTDDPVRYVGRLLNIWRTALNPSDRGVGLTFSVHALQYWCAWLIDDLEQDQSSQRLPTYPVLTVSKTELMAARPELAITVASLNAAEMQGLVQQVEAALQPFYLSALKLALDRFFEINQPSEGDLA